MNREWVEVGYKSNGDILEARKEVLKKPLGIFRVFFEINAETGETAMRVKASYGLSIGKASYKTLKVAINAVVEYFDEIDDIVKKLPKMSYTEADWAYRRVIAREVAKIKGGAV